MARSLNTQKRAPGLLYILAALLVVGVAGARFLGFAPPGDRELPPPGGAPPGRSEPAPGVLPAPSAMSQVLIYHTHTTENYHPQPTHADRGPGDVVKVGEALVEALREHGVGAVHVATVHDLPDWRSADERARESVTQALGRHDGLRAVLDIHRDALPQGQGAGGATVAVNGEEVARILLIVGTSQNPFAQENTRYANRLKEKLEELAPGITRGVRLLAQPAHGDLHEHSVTVYVGDYAGTTLEQAVRAARILGEAVAALLLEDA